MPYAEQPISFREYINLFNASKIQEDRRIPSEIQGTWEYPRITGDGSTSTLWDSSQTMNYLHHLMTTHKKKNITDVLLSGRKAGISFPDSTNLSDVHHSTYKHVNTNGINQSSPARNSVVLPYTVADTIHLVLPKSRVIAVFREPISRWGSVFFYLHILFCKSA